MTYLNSLAIAVYTPRDAMIGRLAIAGEFELAGGRGIVVHPKRGSVSDRYLTLLAAERIFYVLVDGTALPEIYGRPANGHGLVPMRALPIAHPNRFPTAAVWAALVHLLRTAAGVWADALTLGSGLL